MTILVSFAKLLGTWWLEPCGWLLAFLVVLAALKNKVLGTTGRFRPTLKKSTNLNGSGNESNVGAYQMAKIEASAKVVRTAISTLAALFFVSLGVIVGVVGTVSYYQTKYGTVDASRSVKRENLYVDRETDEYSYWFRLADGTRQWGRFCDDDLAPQFSAGMFLKTLNYVEKPNCWSTHDVVPRYSIRRDNNGNAIYYANAGDAFRTNQAGAAEATGHSAEAAQSAGLD